jgi:hypothetical protein
MKKLMCIVLSVFLISGCSNSAISPVNTQKVLEQKDTLSPEVQINKERLPRFVFQIDFGEIQIIPTADETIDNEVCLKDIKRITGSYQVDIKDSNGNRRTIGFLNGIHFISIEILKFKDFDAISIVAPLEYDCSRSEVYLYKINKDILTELNFHFEGNKVFNFAQIKTTTKPEIKGNDLIIDQGLAKKSYLKYIKEKNIMELVK